MKILPTQLLLLTVFLTATSLAAEQPNSLFLLSDDQAWNGLSNNDFSRSLSLRGGKETNKKGKGKR